MQEGKATEDKIEEVRTWVSTARFRFGKKNPRQRVHCL